MPATDFKKESLPLKIEPYEEAAKSMSLEQFTQQVRYPVLLFQKSTLWDPLLVMARAMEGGGRGTAMVSYDIRTGGRAFISPITKRQTDPTDPGIYVGRDTAANDLVIPVASVSSRHAVFRPPLYTEHWTVTDLGTSNGTWVTDTQCQTNVPLEVPDGSYVRLGGNLIAWFLLAGRLWNVFTTPGELARLIET